ncbi:zonular occludens toxin domain-containing protein [uncultured Adlercreutzia sp.]|uniref:zonular occludens toxin domain-containing protein n=1 Tax=uncultured Adlercreutzia sp. TaxID=875803 RepID=UPI0026F3EB85|nr:zonular occludens toxin domain-containing protein [uncultured Adlercreutzia sp.]
MIYLYSGTPGSGKSLHVARDIFDSLKWKKVPVISNFDVNPRLKGYDERFTYLPNDQLTPDFLYDFARDYWGGRRVREDNILLVIDEAQLVFNSRCWNQGQRMDWIEFFSQHRHFGYKVVLIAQFDRMLDRQIRSLIEIEVNHRRMGSYGLLAAILSLPFRGRLFCAVSYYYGMRERTGSQWFLPRRKYFRVYDSYSRFRQVEGA